MEKFLEYEEKAKRFELNFIRPILTFFYGIILIVNGVIAGISLIIQCFIVLITGKRNKIFNKHIKQFVLYLIQISAYTTALTDQRPQFTLKRLKVFFQELDYDNIMEEFLTYEKEASKLELFIRPLYILVIGITLFIYGVIAHVCHFIQWFFVMVKGKRNEKINSYIRQFTVLIIQVSSYTVALTDKRPELRPKNVIIYLEEII